MRINIWRNQGMRNAQQIRTSTSLHVARYIGLQRNSIVQRGPPRGPGVDYSSVARLPISTRRNRASVSAAPALRQSAPRPSAAPRRELDNKVLAAMEAGEKLIDVKCPGLFALGLKGGKVSLRVKAGRKDRLDQPMRWLALIAVTNFVLGGQAIFPKSLIRLRRRLPRMVTNDAPDEIRQQQKSCSRFGRSCCAANFLRKWNAAVGLPLAVLRLVVHCEKKYVRDRRHG